MTASPSLSAPPPPTVILPTNPVLAAPEPTTHTPATTGAMPSATSGSQPAPLGSSEAPGGDPEQLPDEPASSSPAADAGPTASGVSGGDGGFSIDLVFDDDQQPDKIVADAFESARSRWQTVITGDVPDAHVDPSFTCGDYSLPAQVDDLVIFVSVGAIDGPGQILGASAPCVLRGKGAQLPVAGLMRFDSADLSRFAELGRLEEVILHEMGHVLGVGSLWTQHDLLLDPAVDDSGDADTAFEGQRAIAEFDALGGDDYDGSKVPVENTGGDGVANGHWRESVMGNELMTPFMSQAKGRLSTITIASLEDLGYEVSYDGADEYAWPPPRNTIAGFGTADVDSTPIDLSKDRLQIPLGLLDESGFVHPLR
ncbi:MAG TPA: leishmanolysin-related zinc metalloendopeptidase [Polyangiaceae bacterium]|nr:leishmanolysin-related zinc metalloendopeptidase [Polyangiaceae bacterium]